MKKIILIFTLLIVAVNISFAQDNKVDGKGLRKGQWIVMYKGDFLDYDYFGKLLNLDKMLVTDRETKSEEEASYFETANYNKGIKQGEFQVYSATKNNGDYPLIAMGEYKDGQITGNLIMVGYENNTSPLDQSFVKTTPIRLCYAEYENGKIKDQDILIEDMSSERFNQQNVYPIIKMKDGVCIEETVTDTWDSKVVRLVKTDKGFTMYRYMQNFKKGGISLSYSLEVAKLDDNSKYNGLTSYYRESFEFPYDTTTKLLYRATFKNNMNNGPAYWYYPETGNVMQECNYVDGRLNGVAKCNTKSGQTYVEATFKDGFLDGKYVTYFSSDEPNPIVMGRNCQETRSSNDIFQFSPRLFTRIDDFVGTVKMLRNEGHNISITDGAKIYEATYVNGVIDGKYNFYHSNGKKLYEGVVSDCKEVDWKWFDINGDVIYDKKDETIRLQEERKKQEEFFNTGVVKCTYCNNSIKRSEAIVAWAGCHCFHDNGEGVQVMGSATTYFDSRKCEIEYEEDCCRRNGYRFKK